MTRGPPRGLPPGPRGPALLHTLRYGLDPWSAMRSYARRYGDPFTVPSVLGPVVFTGRPEGAREILSAPEEAFTGFGMESVGGVLGRTSLMLAGGAEHRRMRRLYAPAFRAQRARVYDAHVLAAVERAAASRLRSGASFCAIEASREISLEVIARAVFGGDDEATLAEVRAVLRAMVASFAPWLLFFPALQRARGGRYGRASAALDRVIRAQASRRRRAPGDDVLSQLLAATDDRGRGMTDEELRDQLVTLLIAGYDTSAFSLAWALYYTHRDPAVRARLVAEIEGLPAGAGPDEIARLPYLDAVCHEALRIHPLALEILRTTARPFPLLGHEIPAGVGVGVSAALLHEHPGVYPEPSRFDPERFLRRAHGAHEYVPFGGGAFRCVGAALATREMKLALAGFLRDADLELASARALRPVRKHFLTGPPAPLTLRVVRVRYGARPTAGRAPPPAGAPA